MKKVLIAVGGMKGSEGILESFHNFVSSADKVILLHVEQLEGNSSMTAMLGDAEMSTLRESLKGTEYKQALDRRAERILSYYKAELRLDHATKSTNSMTIKTVIKEGHPEEEILKLADEEGVDLIIVGCSGKTRLQRMVNCCVSKQVEKHAKMHVLIAKGDGCGLHAHLWQGREAYAI
ncbi:MAG TPA: universal stress protein [Dissulfurispiraceae bacterium]|nr:universal stress protein [Dissulfurispiraceae bacterium]